MSGTQPTPSSFVFGTSSSSQAAGTPSSTPAFMSGTQPSSSLFVFGTSSSSLAAGTPSSTPAFMSGTQPSPSLFVFGTSSSSQAAGTPSSTPAFMSGTQPSSSLFVFGTSPSSLDAGTPSSTPAFMSGTQPSPSLFVLGTSSSSLAAGTPSSTPAFMSGTQPSLSLLVLGTSSSSLAAGTPSSTPAFMSGTQPSPSLFVFGTSSSSLAAGTPSSTFTFDMPSSTLAFDTPSSTPALGTPSMPSFATGMGSSLFSTQFSQQRQHRKQHQTPLFRQPSSKGLGFHTPFATLQQSTPFRTSSSSLAAGAPSSTPAFMSVTQPSPSLFVFGTSSLSLAAGTPSSTFAFDMTSSTPAFDTPSSTLAFGNFIDAFLCKRRGFGQLNPFSLLNAQSTTQMAPIAQSTQSEETLIKWEDSIDRLPDDVLGCILSLFTVNEAARTSALSRRWKYLWIFNTCCLDFDNSQMVIARRSLEVKRRKFVNWVNHVLSLYQGQTIDKFIVCFDLDEKNSKTDIDNWIKFALGKRVKQLKLAFAFSQGYFGHGSYTLTTQFLRDYCIDSLTSLQLYFVEVTGEDLQYILLNCKFLQVLCVVTSKSLVILEVPFPDLKLKCLEIRHCSSIEYMDISGFNLVSFKYYGPKIKISFKDVPQLVEASIGGHFASFLVENMFQFSSYVSCLETLVLDVSVQKYLTFPKFPTLQNLKQLDLWLNAHNLDSILFCTSLLKASPMLLRFTLKILALGPCNRRKLEKKKIKHPYQCLKLVEVVGFVGCVTDFEFVLHILENAVSLEKVIINPYSPYDMKSPYDSGDSEKSAARSRARQLEKQLRPGVELVIL